MAKTVSCFEFRGNFADSEYKGILIRNVQIPPKHISKTAGKRNAFVYHFGIQNNRITFLLLQHMNGKYGPPGGMQDKEKSEWNCVQQEYVEEVGYLFPDTCTPWKTFDIQHTNGSHPRCYLHQVDKLTVEGRVGKHGISGEIRQIRHFSLADINMMLANKSHCELRGSAKASTQTVVKILNDNKQFISWDV